MPLKLIDGELVEVNDDGQAVDEENTEQVNNTNNNQNISEEVDNNQEVDDRPNWFDEIANEVLSTPATASF